MWIEALNFLKDNISKYFYVLGVGTVTRHIRQKTDQTTLRVGISVTFHQEDEKLHHRVGNDIYNTDE